MAIPQRTQLATPLRSVTEYAVGNPDMKPDLSTAATSPTVGGLGLNPPAWRTVGVASETFTVLTSAVAAATYGVVVNNKQVPLPGLNPNNAPITFDPNDQVWLTASLNDVVSIPVGGININAVQVTPYGITTDKVIIRGPFLPPNVEYTQFGVYLTIYAYCINAVAANASYAVRVDAMLFNLPG